MRAPERRLSRMTQAGDWWRALVQVKPGEGKVLAWSCAYFFLLLSSYYVLRPLRDEMGLRSTDNALTLLFMGTLAGTIAINPLFGALVRRYPRRVFVPVVYHALALMLLGFYLLLRFLSAGGGLAVARVFFVWVSVFNLLAVSVFWGFMADIWESSQGKRLFGLIGVGGTLGAVAGGALTASLAHLLGANNLLLLAALLLEGAVLAVRRLTRLAPPRSPAAPPGELDLTGPRAWFEGFRLIARSSYLSGICLLILFYSIGSTFLYFEQARITRDAFVDSAARVAFFARVDIAVNALALATQLFLTGRLIGWLGVGTSLAVMPVLTAGGVLAVANWPILPVLVAVQVLRRASEFALVRPAREVLFTVVTRDEKYTAKSLIDTFVYRTGDALGAWGDRLLAAGAGLGQLAALVLPLGAVWMALAAWLGWRQRTYGARGSP